MIKLFGFLGGGNNDDDDDDDDRECPRCNGWGTLRLSQGQTKTCPRCNGSGSI